MPPKSRLSSFIIDCNTKDLDGAAQFWARALGRAVKLPPEGADRYRELSSARSEPVLAIQTVTHESRIHLDIEADDIPGEVARLESLGARRVGEVHSWFVMEAPTGQRFCVVKAQRPKLRAGFDGSPEHERLLSLAGRYTGRTRVWLDPSAPPDESDSELVVQPILGGRWLRLEEQGSMQGRSRAGEMLLGFHRDAKQWEMTWVDTFHTGTSVMISTGAPRADGVIAVTGSYAAGSERWGWRTELDARDGLTLRAINITPSGEESPAIETRWRAGQ